jgi:hypothetical protein
MAGNYVLLETIELTQAASSVTLDNIPQTGYTDLKLVMSARSSSTFGVVWYDTYITVNSNGALSWRDIIGLGSGTPTSRTDTASFVALGVSSSAATTSTFGNTTVYFPGYNSTTTFKSASMESASENNGTASAVQLSAGLYSSNTAISSITITPYNSPTAQFVQYSTFSLYGIAALGTEPVVAPKATGGNIVANDGTYWYHAFLTSGTFTPRVGLTADVLVVAGGGGGGCDNGGGGGAGGLRGATAQSLATASYPVVVGAGGTKSSSATAVASNGSNSSFNSFSATGGGGGASLSQNPIVGSAGGSGGGSAGTQIRSPGLGGAGNAGGYTPVEGYAGPNAVFNLGGTGGGGAAAAGSVQPSNANGGAGGVGSSAFSSWGAATGTGQLVSSTRYYAGGGGGGADAATGGAGGFGGGASGANIGLSPSADAMASTGGGGGGGGGNNAAGVGSNGGSGIIIIRYAMA